MIKNLCQPAQETMREYYDEIMNQRGLRLPSQEELSLEYQERIERDLVPDGALVLGTDPDTARYRYLMPDELKLGLHMIGGPGQGKSNALKYLASQIIDQNEKTGDGCAILDPHGDVAEHLLDACINRALDPSRVVYVDLKDGASVPVINPLYRHGDTVRIANGLVEAITRAFGLELVMENPLTAEAMINTAIVLLEKGYSLAETTYFMHQQSSYEPIREYLLRGSIAEDYWKDIAELPKRDRRMEIASAARRFNYFLRFPSLRCMLGQTEVGIDVGRIMDEGGIAIFNLGLQGTEITHQVQRFLGALILDQFKNAALRRRKHRARPFYLFIDEFSYFTSYDTMEALAEARGFGLRLILAHQRMDQLMMKDQDPRLLKAVLSIPNKLIFGAGLVDDQLQLARQAFAPWLDRQKRRLEIYHRGFKPILEKVEVRSRAVVQGQTEFQAEGTADGDFQSDSFGSGSGASLGLITPPGGGLLGTDPTTTQHTQASTFAGSGRGRSHGSSRSSGQSQGSSTIEGVSESFVTKHEEYSELSSVQFDEVDQQLFGLMQDNIRRGVGHSLFVRGFQQEPAGIVIPEQVDQEHLAAKRLQFLEQVVAQHPGYYLSRDKARAALAEREQKLLSVAGPQIESSSGPKTRRRRRPDGA